MGDGTQPWPMERRAVPPEFVAAAAASPGGVLVEIDHDMVPDPDGYVPPEAILGAFVVGDDGIASGDYLRNPNYGPVRDDFTALTSPDHWLGWLGDQPELTVRSGVESLLTDQVPGARLEWFKVVDEPVFLTGVVRGPGDAEKVLVRRAAAALPFALSVLSPPNQRHILTGVVSLVAVGLDEPDGRRDRTWLDLGMERADAAELLDARIYELDADD